MEQVLKKDFETFGFQDPFEYITVSEKYQKQGKWTDTM